MTGVMRKSILVTGASAGLGAASVHALVGRGHRVYAGVRRSEDGLRLVRELGERCIPLILDVQSQAAIARSIADIRDRGGLDVLVNNAGVAVSGPLELLPLDKIREQFEINVFGALALTQAALPLLRVCSGRVLMVGSVAGRNAMPMLGAYCASKSAIEALTQSLRMELVSSGVKVVLIEPGSFKSRIWKGGDELSVDGLSSAERSTYGRALKRTREIAFDTGRRATSTDQIAHVVVDAVERRKPRRRYVVGGDARFQLLLGAAPMWFREPLLSRLLYLSREEEGR